jgi:hypothetical protein
MSVSAIWTGATAASLRQDLNGGGSKFCGDCPLKLPLKKDDQPPQRGLDVGALPSRLYIECTAACNISCAQACCAPETGITRTRQAGMLDFEVFRKVIDEAGPSLVRVDFFNYGETFLHKRAIEMCEYIKARFPHIYLYTSTNGLAFKDHEQVRRLIAVRYRRGDVLDRRRDAGVVREVSAARRLRQGDRQPAGGHRGEARGGPRRAVHQLALHPLHAQRQPEEMDHARRMADEIGVDRLTWELTDHPEDMFSRRFLPGSADLDAIRHEIWDANNLGNAIPGATPRAEIAVKMLVPALPVVARRGRKATVKARVRNASTRPFPAQASYGRRLVRLGAQLCGPDGTLLNRDYERAWLPDTLQPGAAVDVPVTITAPAEPGRYALKFDLVERGIDWFEACGMLEPRHDDSSRTVWPAQ